MKSFLRFGSAAGVAFVLLACSGSDSTHDLGGDAGADTGSGGGGDDGGACGPLGDSCKAGTNDCPQGLTCEGTGEHDFCARQHATCGGIAGGSKCPASAPRCMVVGGAADYGICMTDDERQCACTKTPQSFTAASCGIR